MKKITLLLLACLAFLTPSMAFSGFGTGVLGDPYQITTAAQLDEIRNDLGSSFILMNNIDVSSITNWIPLGDLTTKFTGTFNGNGFTISNLTSSQAGVEFVGMFGYVDGGTITNVKLANLSITGGNRTAGLAGYASATSTITDCSTAGNVTGAERTGGLVGNLNTTCVISNCSSSATVIGTRYVGGLIGYASSASATSNCYTTGSVTGTISEIGGLIGYLANNSGETDPANTTTLKNSYSSASVTGVLNVGGLVGYAAYLVTVDNSYSTGNVIGTDRTGGLVGRMNYGAIVSACYSTATVTSNKYGGGFVGHNNQSIAQNCYALGNVTRPTGQTDSNFSNFCGYTEAGASLINCYATGSITFTDASNPNNKGIVGGQKSDGATYTYTNNFFNTETSEQTAPKVDGAATALTTAQMKSSSNYTGWDFSNVWQIEQGINNGYPFLLWKATTYTSSWDNGEPTSTKFAIVAGDLTVSSAFAAEELAIQPGKSVNVQSGNAITCGNTYLEADATSEAQLLLPVGHANLVGVIEVYFPADQYKGFGFGMSGLTVSNVSPQTPLNWFVKEFDETTAFVAKYVNNWKYLQAVNTPTLSTVKGYLGYSSGAAQTVKLSGNLSAAASATFGLTMSASAGDGWNLLVNPFNSKVNVDNFLTSTNWTDANIDNSVSVFNGTTWVTTQLTASTAVLRPSQAFFVKANAASPSLMVSAGARTVTGTPAAKKSDIQKIEITASLGNVSDQTLIYAYDGTTENYDGGAYESQKMFGLATAPQVFTRVGEYMLSNNAVSAFENNATQTFEVSTPSNGVYNILVNLSGLGEFTDISVLDIKTGVQYSTSFSIEGVAGETRSFVINLGKKALAAENKPALSSIFATNNQVVIQLQEAQAAQIYIYDVAGKQVKAEQMNETIKRISLPQGAYIVKLAGQFGQQVSRVIVK